MTCPASGRCPHDWSLTWPRTSSPPRSPAWLTGITEHRTAEGTLYRCPIQNVCSQRIVGYSLKLENDCVADSVGFAERPRAPRRTAASRRRSP